MILDPIPVLDGALKRAKDGKSQYIAVSVETLETLRENLQRLITTAHIVYDHRPMDKDGHYWRLKRALIGMGVKL